LNRWREFLARNPFGDCTEMKTLTTPDSGAFVDKERPCPRYQSKAMYSACTPPRKSTPGRRWPYLCDGFLRRLAGSRNELQNQSNRDKPTTLGVEFL